MLCTYTFLLSRAQTCHRCARVRARAKTQVVQGPGSVVGFGLLRRGIASKGVFPHALGADLELVQPLGEILAVRQHIIGILSDVAPGDDLGKRLRRVFAVSQVVS